MAAAQVAYLSHGFFPRLGPAFVRRWHASYLDDPRAIALVAVEVEGARPVGFLLGSSDHGQFVPASIARHRRQLLSAGALALARRPGLLVHFLQTRAMHYARRLLAHCVQSSSVGATAPAPAPAVAVVSALVVEQASRGRGVGHALITTFLARAREAGTGSAELVTTARGGADTFYRRLGWRESGRRIDRSGVEVFTFGLDLGLPEPTGDHGEAHRARSSNWGRDSTHAQEKRNDD